MTTTDGLHLFGRRAAAPTVAERLLDLDAGPGFMTDPRRGCSPTRIPNPEIFTSDSLEDLQQAEKICRKTCPFMDECGTWATETGQRYYVWGGRLRSRAKAKAAAS
jgi:hypothetical protein